MKKKPNPKKRGGRPIGTERARELSLMRRTFAAGPGRPKSDKVRCFCGVMTLRRAIYRNHNCDEAELVQRRKEGKEA